jgi:hypothetical protein
LNFPFEEVRVIKKEVITLMLFTIIANCLGNLGSDIVRSAYRAITRSYQHNQQSARLSRGFNLSSTEVGIGNNIPLLANNQQDANQALFKAMDEQSLPPRQRPPGSVA